MVLYAMPPSPLLFHAILSCSIAICLAFSLCFPFLSPPLSPLSISLILSPCSSHALTLSFSVPISPPLSFPCLHSLSLSYILFHSLSLSLIRHSRLLSLASTPLPVSLEFFSLRSFLCSVRLLYAPFPSSVLRFLPSIPSGPSIDLSFLFHRILFGF